MCCSPPLGFREMDREQDVKELVATFYADESGSDIVEFVFLTAIVLLGTGAVLVRLREEVADMFVRILERHLL